MNIHTRVIAVVALITLGAAGNRSAKADAAGSLLVESDPAGASVYVDGRLAGETPLTLPAIAAGVHRVRVMRLGYLENSRLVTIKARARAHLRTQLTAAAPPLKIVVIEGEGAVNIIQQKTAVAPVVEVRDRNDQPVSGAIVRFAIQKGRASFNGVRTLTATTDALGRATAAGLTPAGSGPLQIGASAAFQGQSAAITIAQTNVLTAAQAAAAAGAGSSGASAGGGGAAAGGGGGGLSNTAIAGIIGGAGAGVGAAVLAKSASHDDGDSSAVIQPPTGFSVLFSPGLDITACGPAPPGQSGPYTSQRLNVDTSGAFHDTWPTPTLNVIRVDGTLTANGVSATLRCVATPATGSMSATPSGADYLGTATLGGSSTSIRIVKAQGS